MIIVATVGRLAILIARRPRSIEPKDRAIKVGIGHIRFAKFTATFPDIRTGGPSERERPRYAAICCVNPYRMLI
jgi:hypothetical protein